MNIETDVNLTKKKRIIFWVYLFTILAFFTTITILSVYSYIPTKNFVSTDNYFYANQVANDWSTGKSSSIQASSLILSFLMEPPPAVQPTIKMQSTSTGPELPMDAIATSTRTSALSSVDIAPPD
jgi:hypothetical protein